MNKNEIISSGILELYVLGFASPEEKMQVEQWIQQYPEIKAELNEIELGLETYIRANSMEPTPDTKNKILAAINSLPESDDIRSGSGRVTGITPVWKWVAAASIILLIGSGIFNAVYYNKYLESTTAYEETNKKLLASSEALNEYEQEMSVVKNKYSLPVALNGLPASPEAAAKIFWMKNTGEVYLDPSNLPEPPKGKQYQLWAIVDGKPVDGGMISFKTSRGNKYSIQRMKTFGKAEAFAVTLEKEGGNPTPQGEMYVMGKM